MNKILLSTSIFSFLISISVHALGPSNIELLNDELETENVTVYGMGYKQQRHSPLTVINKDNISRLAPKWMYSLDNDRGQQAFPLVFENVIYFVI